MASGMPPDCRVLPNKTLASRDAELPATALPYKGLSKKNVIGGDKE